MLQVSIRKAVFSVGVFEVSECVIGSYGRSDTGSVHDRQLQGWLPGEENAPRFVAFCHNPILGGIMGTDSFTEATNYAVYGILSTPVEKL